MRHHFSPPPAPPGACLSPARAPPCACLSPPHVAPPYAEAVASARAAGHRNAAHVAGRRTGHTGRARCTGLAADRPAGRHIGPADHMIGPSCRGRGSPVYRACLGCARGNALRRSSLSGCHYGKIAGEILAQHPLQRTPACHCLWALVRRKQPRQRRRAWLQPLARGWAAHQVTYPGGSCQLSRRDASAVNGGLPPDKCRAFQQEERRAISNIGGRSDKKRGAAMGAWNAWHALSGATFAQTQWGTQQHGRLRAG